MRNGLFVAIVILAVLGLGAEVVNHCLRRPYLQPLVAFLSLSFEHNLPSWYASSLLLACSAALGAVAIHVGKTGGNHLRHWQGLAFVFAYMSLDEAVEIHEHLGGLLRLGGVFYFSWIVPAAAAVAVIGAVYLRFLGALPRDTRVRFVTAGVIYVGGALFMELPLGWWTERAGDDNLVYALIDWLEEVFELVGATLFLLSVVRHLDELTVSAAVASPGVESRR